MEDLLKDLIDVAKNSTCEKSKCGSIILKNNKIIGKGFNSPPKDSESQRRCQNSKETYHNKVTDKTCCVHAEQRAIMDALKNNPSELKDSKLYFIRINNDGTEKISGKPYCTICSKMALDLRISKFVLFEKNGFQEYDAEEYNNLSYSYKG